VFIQLAMHHLVSDEPKVKSYRTYLMEVVINAIYYNPRLAMHVLEANGWTNKFLSLWFSNIDNFTRVHDKKLAIVAIVELLSLQAHEIPVSVQQGWPRLLTGIVRLFQTLPAAVKNREEVTKEDNYEVSGDVEEDEEEWNPVQDWENENDDAEDVQDESTAYLEFLNEEAQKFNNLTDDDDELEEDNLLDTAIERLEPYGMLKGALMHVQQSQPQIYESLTKNLTPEEQAVIQAVINQADVIAHNAATTAALEQHDQANGQTPVTPSLEAPSTGI